MEKKPKLEFKCCYSICENYYPDKQIHFVQFPETCLQFQQNCINGSIQGHIIHCRDCEKASKWLEACGRRLDKNIYDITKNLYICGKHFVGGKGPTEENPYPIPITVAEMKTEEMDTNFIKEEKIEIEEHSLEEIKEEKHNCGWIKQESDIRFKEHGQPKCEKIEIEEHPLEEIKEEKHHSGWIKQEENIRLKEYDQPQCSKQNTNKPGVSTQTEFGKAASSQTTLFEEDSIDDEEESMDGEESVDEEELMEEDSVDSDELTDTSEYETEDSEEDTSNMSRADFQEQSMKHNKRDCYYSTGFHYDQICSLLKFFGMRPKISDTKLTPIQQLIIVLMRLRRNSEICDLAIRNGTTSKFIIQLVKTWVLFMHSQFAKRFKEQMPKKIDFKKLKGFEFLKNANPLNNGGSLAPFVLVCACLLKFQASQK